ncbi:MAG: sensor histidine kinase [Chitinophagaceae bacterium]|nr:sensor histidine kinase [Chitinophagaceae bacterium]
MKNPFSSSVKLAAVFLVFGVTWIFASDLISKQITRNDLELYSLIQHSKGVLFMILAAVLIYFGSRKIVAQMEQEREKWIQGKLEEEREKQRLEITQAVLTAQEAERKKLGEELHDNVNQLLGVVKLYVQHAQVNKEMQQELLEKCSDYLIQVIEEIRQLSRSMLPPALHENGLLTSLHQLVDAIRVVNTLHIELRNDGIKETDLPEQVQLMLYRIIQEQLNNVLKHAAASHVKIHLEQQNKTVHLTISDNGKGFDPHTNIPGMGLMNIRSRLEQVNGKMLIHAAPENGCTLAVSFHL